MRIALSKTGFCLHHGFWRKSCYDWADVRRIDTIWQQGSGFQHLVLTVRFHDRSEQSISELTPGFDRFEAQLTERLRGIDADWRQRIEEAPKDEPQRLWGR